MIQDQQLASLFRAESEERLARLDEGLLTLETQPDSPGLIEALFREMHSLKGAARMLGLVRIENLAHELESLLNAAVKSGNALAAADIGTLEGGLGKLRGEIQSELDDGAPPRPQKAATVPSPSQAGTAVPSPSTAEFEAPAPPIDTVRVETGKLDALLTLAGELGILRGRARHRQALLAQARDQWASLERIWRRMPAATGDSRPANDTEEGSSALTRLSASLDAAAASLQEDAGHFEATLGRLQEVVQDARLLPLSVVFSALPRMVRDLARERGKEVALQVSGAHLTLDKQVIEEIKDPLLHLLRNAIAHGIEPPARRLESGKPAAGRIEITAERSHAHIRVRVSDDGVGLDLAAIRRRAIERGLIDAEAAEAATEAQLQQLAFLPGLSTSDTVDELSGRGVGLDVVSTNVQRLNGSIELESRHGRGTTVTLCLPLSLTTLRMLVVRVGGQLFGLPADSVRQMRTLTANGIYALNARPMVNLDDAPVPVRELAELLALPPSAETAMRVCVFVHAENQTLGLAVDDIVGEEEVLPRPLGLPLKRVRNLASLATLAGGEICPILNPADLLRTTAVARQRQPATPEPAGPAARPAILLVEDSALVRAMEKRILEDAGYDVVVAVDGIDALDKVGSREFAGVVSDIQMPNLDGLGLTERLRSEARYHDLPVILVSALDSEADKRRGLQVGASAYLPKPGFDQRELVETLRRLIGR